MKKFNDIEYSRPNIEEFKKEFLGLLDDFKNAKDAKTQIDIFYALDKKISEISDKMTIVSIRNSIDTTDKFYEKEQAFFDETSPYLSELYNSLDKELNVSKFKDELIKEFGEHLFNKINVNLKTFDSKIISLLQEENKLSTKYSKLIATAKIEFDGKELNINQLKPYAIDKDRKVRESANKALFSFFHKHMDEFDKIYDELVKVRHKQAKELGFKNYVELGYYKLARTDYNSLDVKKYRKQVLEDLVPLYKKLVERQRERLGYDKLYFYDKPFSFHSGNPKPKGGVEWQVDKAKKMYSELSAETKEFFDKLVDCNLLDLPSRDGKRNGGYCTLLEIEKMPFIFANFNGTQHDVVVLTHEAGHAFQVYKSSRSQKISSYYWPTYEAAEIHSMSMEFITWPYMNLFFEDETDKFKFSHLEDSIRFIPYGVTVDEFQHFVYENPDASPKQRREKWVELTKKYGIYLDNGSINELDEGIYWFMQLHIFSSPFYYIDYTLAQVCAFQFLINSRKDKEKTWKTYVELCKLGGSLPFTKLVEKAGLLNPFKDGTIKQIMPKLEEILNTFDDKTF